MTNLQSIDIVLDNKQQLEESLKAGQQKRKQDQVENAQDSPGDLFYRRYLHRAANSHKAYVATRLFFPATAGYVSWAGIFGSRMVDCPDVVDLFSAFKPLQSLSKSPLPVRESDIASIFAEAVAGVMIESSSEEDLDKQWLALDEELVRRLSLPWLSPTPLNRTRLAVIEGGFNLDFRQNMLDNAFQLGIDLVILDKPGHWLASPDYSHLRQAFLPLDTTLDNDLPGRIVQAMKDCGLQFDGITSFSDLYLVAAGRAAEMLNLQTSPSASLAKVVNKHACRQSLRGQPEVFCCSSFDDLVHQTQKSQHTLSYPLIIKPTVGGGSQGVARVDTEHQLESAIEYLIAQHGHKVVVEPYVDGPEFDANFVLSDKKVLFCEVSDNSPCAGDTANAGRSDSFLETGIIFPSALDDAELVLAKGYLHQVLLDLGFSTGVFHVEARMVNSTKEYRAGEDGVLDLQRKDHPVPKPEVFLLEVNARPPGRQALNGVARCYGIDYYVMQLLFAVGASHRAEQLCHSFVGGSQYACCEAVYIPALEGGIFDSDDIVQDLLDQEPDLRTVIVEHHVLFHRGEPVPDPRQGKLRWIATFLIASKARHDTLRLGATARREIKYNLAPA
jgi:glutathione synthase/RimK-type ligase-like ATP-grasp enzyme